MGFFLIIWLKCLLSFRNSFLFFFFHSFVYKTMSSVPAVPVVDNNDRAPSPSHSQDQDVDVPMPNEPYHDDDDEEQQEQEERPAQSEGEEDEQQHDQQPRRAR